MKPPSRRILPRLLRYWAMGLLVLALVWVAPVTRRLAAALVRLVIVLIAPALPARVDDAAAAPTWVFALALVVAGALLGLVFYGVVRLLRGSRAARRDS
jgi:uncharacterized membrane protein